MAMIKEKLKNKAKTLPGNPGCYLMKNSHGHIIYVGKAKDLKKRVLSYFQESAKTPKTEILVSHIRDFEFMITQNETEAFILENNLIKKHKPKYNIRLKDDKSFPYIVIDQNHSFPMLEYKRKPKRQDKTLYFGPFSRAFEISQVVKTLTKVLRLRDCSNYDFSTRKEPCLLHQMNQCTAPCVDYINALEYQVDLERAIKFLGGQDGAQEVIHYLENLMEECAFHEEFERAALIRDSIKLLGDYLEHSNVQNVENSQYTNLDLFSFYQGEKEIDISLYMIRGRNLMASKTFHFYLGDLIEDIHDEILKSIYSYYKGSKDLLPEVIAIDLKNDLLKDFTGAMKESFLETKFKIIGKKRELSNLFKTVALHAEEVGRVRSENLGSHYQGLQSLQKLLKLKERPVVLECYDIAIWQGKSPTAAQIVFYNGEPEKKSYRYYHLEEVPEKNNDFKMLQEVFSRRLKKDSLPDVFVIDGGLGQVNAVKKILSEFKIEIPVVGIAKARSEHNTEERLIIPNRKDAYPLRKSPELMKIIVTMRDEAHRFSRKLHHKTEHKRITHSVLDEISGVGSKNKVKILNHPLFDAKKIKHLSVDELQKTFSLTKSIAQKIFQHFN